MKQQHLFRLNILCLSLMTALPAYADVLPSGQVMEKQLDTVQVNAKKQKTRRDNEVTGLGKPVKSSETLSKEQVLNIRDLTRYDPGIAVVEQGRGASSGYSIRGMDKNRVSLTVDGVSQIQSHTAQAALGGTRTAAAAAQSMKLSMKTLRPLKSARFEFIRIRKRRIGRFGRISNQNRSRHYRRGKQWGIQSKTAYSGKDHALTQSLALAGRSGGAEAPPYLY